MKRAAFITGSTSGIGLGIAKRLAKEGYFIALNGFGDSYAIESTLKEIRQINGGDVLYSNADVSKPEEIENAISMIAAAFGGIDILVNNAGVQHVSPIESFPSEKWDAILAIDLSSAFHTIRHSIPLMKEKGWGRIINIASAHALVASPFKSAYVAAKHGLAGLTKTVALEVAQQGITCNAICPGYVLTPLVEGQIDATAQARDISRESVIKDVMLGNQPTKEFVRIEEVAELVAYLCNDFSGSINGSLLSMDGGWTAH